MPNASPQNKKDGVLGFCCGLIIQTIGWLLLAWLVALFIAVVILIYLGQHAGLEYLSALFQAQAVWLEIKCAQLPLAQNWIREVFSVTDSLQNLSTHFTTLHNFSSSTCNSMTRRWLQSLYPLAATDGYALLLATQLVIVRIALIILFLPFFGLLAFIGFVDGFSQRYLRRLQGGRESALIYHQAKNAILPACFLGGFIYVIVPFTIAPEFILVPSAILVSAAIFLATKTFKKYL